MVAISSPLSRAVADKYAHVLAIDADLLAVERSFFLTRRDEGVPVVN